MSILGYILQIFFLYASKATAVIKLDVTAEITLNKSFVLSRKIKIFKLLKNLHCVTQHNSGKFRSSRSFGLA